jgi:hypothetical protein
MKKIIFFDLGVVLFPAGGKTRSPSLTTQLTPSPPETPLSLNL